MSKLTQGHINCLANWMLNNPSKKLNVTGTWRNNGYEVLNGYQTPARKKAYKILLDQGYEIDKIQGCLISRRKLSKSDIKASEVKEPKAENLITQKGKELLEKALVIAKTPPTYEGKHPEVQTQKQNLTYTTDLKPESVQAIAKSLQGMAYTAQLMGKGATVTVRVEMGV